MTQEAIRTQNVGIENGQPDQGLRSMIGRDLVKAVVAGNLSTCNPALGGVRQALGLEGFDLMRSEDELLSTGEIEKTRAGYEIGEGSLTAPALAFQSLMTEISRQTAEFQDSIASQAREVVERQYFPDTDTLF